MEELRCVFRGVGFNIGGLQDLVKDPNSGYLTAPWSIGDLAKGIIGTLNSEYGQAIR